MLSSIRSNSLDQRLALIPSFMDSPIAISIHSRSPFLTPISTIPIPRTTIVQLCQPVILWFPSLLPHKTPHPHIYSIPVLHSRCRGLPHIWVTILVSATAMIYIFITVCLCRPMHTPVIHPPSRHWFIAIPLRWYDSVLQCHNIHPSILLVIWFTSSEIHLDLLVPIIHQYYDCMLPTSTIFPCCICFASFRIAMAHPCVTRITPYVLHITHHLIRHTCLFTHSCAWVHPPVYPTCTGQCAMHCRWFSSFAFHHVYHNKHTNFASLYRILVVYPFTSHAPCWPVSYSFCIQYTSSIVCSQLYLPRYLLHSLLSYILYP